MHKLPELREKLCNELESYCDMKLDTTNVPIIDTLAHTIKNIDKIMEYEERQKEPYDASYGTYDYRRTPRMTGTYQFGNNMNRDSMGRYARGGNGYSMNGYSRGGYDPIAELTAAMNDATDERTRMEIQGCIQRIQGM